MVGCGVRLLFVTETHGLLQGLVTYTDLFGEKTGALYSGARWQA